MQFTAASWHFHLGTQAKSILSIHLGHEETPDMKRIISVFTPHKTAHTASTCALSWGHFGHNVLILGGHGNTNKALL